MTSFEFYRFRFHFQAVDRVRFPPGAANVVRGACGTLLREIAPPGIYRRLFRPGGGAVPSGLADWPRPFLFRCAHLNGVTFRPADGFYFDAHVFDLQEPVLPYFQAAFAELAAAGIGPGRGRARLAGIDSLDLEDRALGPEAAPCSVALDPGAKAVDSGVDSILVRFVTPTELKADGRLAERPEFPTLFARLRDRISTLRSLYGQGTLEVDFRGMGERAAEIVLTRCEMTSEKSTRTSSRTGQTHPLGGFVGEAEYQGVLDEFLPWLRAARWVGVGRQTVWGKGEVRVIHEHRATASVILR